MRGSGGATMLADEYERARQYLPKTRSHRKPPYEAAGFRFDPRHSGTSTEYFPAYHRAMPVIALDLRSVSVRYPASLHRAASAVLALDGVTLAVGAGDSVGVVGEPGSGKSTLLLAAAGLLTLAGGELRGNRVAFVSARGVTHSYLGVQASLEIAARTLDPDRVGGLPSVRDVLSRAGLTHRARARVRELNAGTHARLAVAHALLERPRVLCLDDAFDALDQTQGRMLGALLSDLRAEGMALLLSARHPAQLAGVATRLVALRRGRIAGEASSRPVALLPRGRVAERS